MTIKYWRLWFDIYQILSRILIVPQKLSCLPIYSWVFFGFLANFILSFMNLQNFYFKLDQNCIFFSGICNFGGAFQIDILKKSPSPPPKCQFLTTKNWRFSEIFERPAPRKMSIFDHKKLEIFSNFWHPAKNNK